MIHRQPLSVPSSDGIHTLQGWVYVPNVPPCGLFQVVHGMTEHIGRYHRFMTDMAEQGWICFGCDNLGHGNSVLRAEEHGYIAPKDGWLLLARDVGEVANAVKRAYHAESRPYCLMGHSMGSFIVRLAAVRLQTPDKLIVMGTGGPNGAVGAGLALISLLKVLYSDRHVSPLIDQIAFGGYNKRFGGGSEEDPKPWLTRDEAVRRAYYADPFCTFPFTVSAMGDLIRLIREVNRPAWFRSLPKEMPVLLVSGENDPVGNYGKGVKQVADILEREHGSVSCILYPDVRHEILNDTSYEAVLSDILAFSK
ncbi:MAG: alpha/beta fold hydrolase [Clostridia bacterium]|nr:alpha/beta fold hydrolase [Clostridia bacterium]